MHVDWRVVCKFARVGAQVHDWQRLGEATEEVGRHGTAIEMEEDAHRPEISRAQTTQDHSVLLRPIAHEFCPGCSSAGHRLRGDP